MLSQVLGSVALEDCLPLGIAFLAAPLDAPVLLVASPFQEE